MIIPSQIDAKAKDWKLVPGHLRLSLKMWVDCAVPPGRFLTAVLKNDLQGAVLHADPENTSGIVGLVRFIHSFAPALCWGSPERFAQWPDRVRAMELMAEGAAAAGVQA